MAQVAQVADHDIVHVDDINGIAAKLLAPLIIVIGGDAGNQNVADLVFSRPPHNPWIPAHAHSIVMAWMIVADGDNRGGNLTQPGSICGASLGRKRIGNQGDALALELKARVAKPGNFHLLPISLFSKVQAGTDVVLARMLLYHRDRLFDKGIPSRFSRLPYPIGQPLSSLSSHAHRSMRVDVLPSNPSVL